MELDQLKSAWTKMAEQSEKQPKFAESDISLMVSKRTKDISQKIGRNIRIGMLIILAWIAFEFVADFFFSSVFSQILDKPYMTEQLITWSYILNVSNYLLVILAIVLFWLRYSNIEKSVRANSDLPTKIKQLIDVIISYKRMFYMILGVVLLFVTISFTMGFIMEFQFQAAEGDFTMSDFTILKQIAIGVSFFLVLGVFVIAYLLLFRLFFRRLYGKYLIQLQSTLAELNEKE